MYKDPGEISKQVNSDQGLGYKIFKAILHKVIESLKLYGEVYLD